MDLLTTTSSDTILTTTEVDQNDESGISYTKWKERYGNWNTTRLTETRTESVITKTSPYDREKERKMGIPRHMIESMKLDKKNL